jgi:hypothetical protein
MNREIVNLTKLASSAMAVLMTGCAISPPALLRVETPVSTPCVKLAPLRPEYEFDRLPRTVPDGEIVLALARDWARGRKYEVALEAVVAGCQ